jgi:hypothetical protein
MRNGSYDEPSRFGLQQIVAAALLAILVVGGVAFFLNRSTEKVEHLALLQRQTRPWCARYHLDEQQTETTHASLVALSRSGAPRWELSGVSAVTSCSNAPTSAATLIVLTFPTSASENMWLEKGSAPNYAIVGDSFPLPVFVGLGWVAVVGWNGRHEGSALTSLSKALKTDYRFSDFASVSW